MTLETIESSEIGKISVNYDYIKLNIELQYVKKLLSVNTVP